MTNAMVILQCLVRDKNDRITFLERALRIATDRAISHGNRLVALGASDINNSQFISMMKHALKETDEWEERNNAPR